MTAEDLRSRPVDLYAGQAAQLLGFYLLGHWR